MVNFGTNAASGNITVKGTNAYGDGAVSVLKVTANPLPDATITPGGPLQFCSGGSVVLNAVVAANRSSQWIKGATPISGATLSAYTATAGAKYKVMVTNTQTGCTKTTPTAIVVTTYPLPAATITPQGSTTFCSGASVVLSANIGTGLTYQWKKGTNIIAGVNLQSYTATTAGTYRVVVTNANNCSKTSAGQLITVNCLQRARFSSPLNMTIFPNPTHGVTTLVFNSAGNESGELTIIDMAGREIIHRQVKAYYGKSESTLDVSGLAKGTYLVKLKTSDSIMITKLVKQ